MPSPRLTKADYIAIQRRLGLEGSLHDFVKMSWHLVEPNINFLDNWHIEVICKHLEASLTGDIKRLCINIPPSFMKSLLTCVFFPVWAWIRNPGLRFIFASFDASLTLRDATKALEVMTSDWFRERWGDRVVVSSDVKKGDYRNSAGGFRFSTSVEGRTTGRHADFIVIDDPIKPQAVTEVSLQNVKDWWRGTLASRLRDPKTGRKIIIMQRLHEDDLTGYVLSEEKDQDWQHVCIPMRAEATPSSTKLWTDSRKEGELLWPARLPETELAAMEKTMGSMVAAAQLQQHPAPLSGGIFKRDWLKFYDAVPAKFDKVIQSWDLTFKDSDGTDYVAGQVWGQIGADFYMLPIRVHARLDFPNTLEAIKKLTKAYPKARAKLVEDKANGPAVISMLKSSVPGLIAVTPEGGKLARANAVAPLFEAGNVHLPNSLLAPWVEEFVKNLCSFPVVAHDDDVDACSQALNYLHDKTTRFQEAMAKAGMFLRS